MEDTIATARPHDLLLALETLTTCSRKAAKLIAATLPLTEG
jgi:hypothetical protein